MDDAHQGLELRSTVTGNGQLLLSLENVAPGEPGDDEVIVRVQASPINPSDLGLLLGPADLTTMTSGTMAGRPTVTASIPKAYMAGVAARSGQSLPVGNEGAGTVVKAGANARAMVGQTVGMVGGAMYAQYRKLPARDCVVLPSGTAARDGASMFVNPLTALAMVETMRREGHTAIIHTAAASNLGQMLNRICLADGVSLVNIVRSEAQAGLLRSLGAQRVLDSTSPDFQAELTDAAAETGATLAFDAIGGGKLANSILHAMEAAANRTATAYSRYGSATFKQVYIYGGLDVSPTFLDRGFGLAWGVCGFLVTPFLAKIGAENAAKLRQRVLDELTTTFKSHYEHTLSLSDALNPETIRSYAKKATGLKYLIDPSL